MRDGAEIQVVGSERQEAWHWPAVINFTLGGAGAGLYIVASIVGNPTHRGLAAMLVVAGFAVVALEAGRPLRAHHLWRNLRQSWMSREVLAAMIFISVSLLDSYRPSAVLATVSAASATALLLCHGFILYRARALPAWNVPIMPVLFITSGLAAGAGAALLVVPQAFVRIGMVCAVADLVAWLAYLRWTREPAFRQATHALRGRGAFVVVVGLGHLLPGMLLGLAMLVPEFAGAAMVAGAAMIVGSLGQKAAIILRAGYLQTIALRLPVGVQVGVRAEGLPVVVAAEKSL